MAEASDSSDDDESPPPLPPPRTESLNPGAVENGEESEEVRLGARMITITDAEPLNTLHNSSKMNGDLTPGDSVSSSSSDNSPSKCILTNNKLEEKKREMELDGERKRKRNYQQREKSEKFRNLSRARRTGRNRRSIGRRR